VSSVTELRHGPVDAFGTAELLTVLGAEAREALTEAAYTATFAAGASLFPESAGADALYVIREGVFHALEPDPPQEPRLVRILGPGDVVDGLLELVGAARPVIVRSVELGVATVFPGEAVDRLVGLHADLRAARDRLHRLQLLSGLSSVFGPIDGALLHALEAEADWIHLQRGEVLWEPGASADGLFFVVSGRVAVLSVRPDGVEELEYEIGRGQTIGAAGFLDGRPRKFRVRAIRDSLLVGYTSAEFERLIARQPQVVRRLTAGLAAQNDSVRRTSGRGVTTVTLMPVSDQASVSKLAERLSVSLSRFGSVLRLDPSRVGQMLTEPGIADAEEGSAEEERLLAFLDACEARHRFVILETTPRGTTWARRCMRLADRLLLVADVRDPSERSHLEHTVTRRANIASSARTSLVLIHLDGTRPPSGTKAWLDERPEVSDHYHVRWDSDADIQRLARVLAGRSVGLVLGGGGARGFAHIGVLRALAENGVPIDAFGGSSMGASVAGQAAMGRPADAIAATTRKVFLEIKPHRGFTLPLLSLVNSRRTEAAGRLCFGDVEIEDLWLPFFCVSSNLTTADVMVHRRGTLWKAALASSSLPGVGTPVLHQGHLLVDGGVLNNLPTDVMRRMGQGTVIASAVSVDESGAFTCERVPTIWEAVRARFGSGGTKDGARFPSILDVVLRASLLHSSFRERANVLAADLTVRPAVQQFGLLEVERIDDIVDAGYREAGITIANWRAQAVEVFS
jgi:NTE family protein/lysophospholipid hydrolase